LIRAGWFVQVQIFGVTVETLPLSIPIADAADRASRPHRKVECTFRATPSVIAIAGRSPLLSPGTIPAGEWTLEFKPPVEAENFPAPSVWLVIHAMDEYDLGLELENAWVNREPQAQSRVIKALEAEHLGKLRPQAELVAGLWTVLYGSRVIVPSVSCATLWDSVDTWTGVTAQLVSEVVATKSITTEVSATQAAAVCVNAYAPSERDREIMRRATSWYLRAKGEADASMERFLWAFLSLEALTYLVDQKATPDILDKYSQLCEVVSKTEPNLIAFVVGLGGRVSQAPLLLRFRRLAEQFGSDSIDDDVALFAKFVALRNSLLHGDYGSESSILAALARNQDIGSLSLKYLRAIMSACFQANSSHAIRA
jgi:hypothetical protein